MDRLSDAEVRVMEALWTGGDQPAGQIARTLQAQVGWNRNTTYTLLKRCIEKGAISRTDPGFHCHALISRDAVRHTEANALMDSLFEGSRELFFASMLGGRRLRQEEIERLHALIDAAGKSPDSLLSQTENCSENSSQKGVK